MLKDRLSSLLSCSYYDQSNRAAHEEDTCDRKDHSTHAAGGRELEAGICGAGVLNIKRYGISINHYITIQFCCSICVNNSRFAFINYSIC